MSPGTPGPPRQPSFLSPPRFRLSVCVPTSPPLKPSHRVGHPCWESWCLSVQVAQAGDALGQALPKKGVIFSQVQLWMP